MERTAYIPITHDDDYWQHDTPLFVGTFSAYYRNEPRMVQGKLSVSEERYSWGYDEIIPLRERAGTRYYVHMRPYVLEPELFLTVGLYPKPKHYADQVVNKVTSEQVLG